MQFYEDLGSTMMAEEDAMSRMWAADQQFMAKLADYRRQLKHELQMLSEQIPKTTVAVLGKLPGSEGNHGQTSEHRQ